MDQFYREFGVNPGRSGYDLYMETGTILDVDYNIACRTGLHCAPLVLEQLGTDKIQGAVRFGIGSFNTEEHIKTAIAAVKGISNSSFSGLKMSYYSMSRY